MSEVVKIVFDIDTADVKSSTDELKALKKVTDEEVKSLEKLSQSAEDAGDGFVSLRSQVKQAKEEAQKAAEKYGEFSKEANEARIRAGKLADQMGDLNRQINLLNPEAKAKAFSNLAQGVVGAFSIATGALQAFGIKNKEVEEAAMKLQAALNITQGIASLGALKESLQDVKVVLGFTTTAQEALTVATQAEAVATTEATVATKGFTASLLTNPIFLTVAAIGALAAAYMTLNNEVQSAILNEEELKKAKEKTVELKNKEAQAQIDLLVATNKITKQEGERRKIELKRLEDTKDLEKQTKNLADLQLKSNQKIIDLTKEAEQLRKDALKERDPELRKALLANAASAKAQVETEKKKNAEIKQSYTALNDELLAINKNAKIDTELQNVDELNANKSTNEKKSQQNKAARDKEAQERAAEWDRIFAEMDAQAKIEADKIEKQNKEKLALEKQLVAETNRARLLLVKGDRIKELQVQMDILDEQYAEDIANAERIGKDTAAIRAKYANDQIELSQQITQASVEEGDKQLKQNEKQQDEQKKLDEKAASDKIATAKFAADAILSITQNLAALQKAQTDQEISDLQTQYDKKLINEKTYNAKLRELKLKQWQADKRAQIASATIGIAQGIINALAVQPANLVPYAIALAGTTGALQLATIIAQKPPQFAKGTLSVPGIDMGRDSVHAILQPGEAVIPTKTNKAYHPTIKAIYEKKISASEINSFVMSRTRSGGSNKVTASVDTYALGRALSKNKTVEVGNANTIGRAMAKELMRSQNPRRS